MATAKCWGDILLRSCAATTRAKWSSKKTRVARAALGRHSTMEAMRRAFPSRSSGRQTPGLEERIDNNFGCEGSTTLFSRGTGSL